MAIERPNFKERFVSDFKMEVLLRLGDTLNLSVAAAIVEAYEAARAQGFQEAVDIVDRVAEYNKAGNYGQVSAAAMVATIQSSLKMGTKTC